MNPEPEPEAPAKPLMLNPRHLAILEACWHYRFLTAWDALYLLNFSVNSLTHVRELLAELCGGEDFAHRHYLYRFPLPIPTGGPRIYTLGAKGRDLLVSLGESADWYFRPHRVKHFSYAHVLHSLLITRLVCAAHAVSRTHQPGFTLVEARLGYELAKTPAMVTLPNEGETSPVPVVPDAILLFAAGQGEGEEDLLPVLLEADRGREHRVSFVKHLRLRLELLRRQAYRHWLGVDALRIAYVTTGERPEYRETRRNAMVRWANEQLAELGKEEYGKYFYFTSVVWEELYQFPCRLFEKPVFYQPGAPVTPVALLAN